MDKGICVDGLARAGHAHVKYTNIISYPSASKNGETTPRNLPHRFLTSCLTSCQTGLLLLTVIKTDKRKCVRRFELWVPRLTPYKVQSQSANFCKQKYTSRFAILIILDKWRPVSFRRNMRVQQNVRFRNPSS